jgi:hypothetical protein
VILNSHENNEHWVWGVDYEKPVRNWHKHSVLNDVQAEFGMAPATEESKKQNAAQVFFLSCLHSEK